MPIILSCRAAICQSVAEVYLTVVAPLGAVGHRFNFRFFKSPLNHFEIVVIYVQEELLKMLPIEDYETLILLRYIKEQLPVLH